MEALPADPLATNGDHPSTWSSQYGNRHRLTRIKEFPPSITPPKRVRINSRRDHFVLQWWDPTAKRNLCARVNGDLVAAISRAREIESRLENSRSSGLGRRKLRHWELVEAFVGDLRRRTDAGEIDARTMVRYQSALDHYLAFTGQTSVEIAFPFAAMINRDFALTFSAFLAERCVSPNGHPNTNVRRMTSTRYVEDVVRAMLTWAADADRGNLLPSDFRNPFLGARRQTMPETHDLFGEPDVTVGMAVEFLSACDDFQLPLFALSICYGLRASEPCFLFREFIADGWMRVPCFPNLAYAPKGRRDKRLPLIEPVTRLPLFQSGGSGLLFLRRDVVAGSVQPHLTEVSLRELEQEFDRRCRRKSVSASERQQIRDAVMRDAGGIQYDHIEHEFHRLAKRLKWPVSATLKDFRHLFSTLMQNGGLPEYYRRYLMGHSPGRAAIVSYTHLNELREHYETAVANKLQPIMAAIQQRQRHLSCGIQ